MYKCQLQQLCHRRRWELPEYSTFKEGPDHMPRFTASVKVHGEVFRTPVHCRSAKEAHNTAARIAFDHFNDPAPEHVSTSPASVGVPAGSLPAVSLGVSVGESSVLVENPASVAQLPSSPSILPPGVLASKNDAASEPATKEILQQNPNNGDITNTSTVHRMAISDDKNYKDMLHIYKNVLQQYAQKQNLGFPDYICEVEGPPHYRRFRSRVILGGKSYETLEFFSTLKEAEHASAKVACHMLTVDVEDVGLYKNLLQELAQKRGLLRPSYETVISCLPRLPAHFVCTVQIGSDSFQGAEAKNKKRAEMNAAKVAYYALTGNDLASQSSTVSPINECAVDDNLAQNVEPVAMKEKHHGASDEEGQSHAKRAKPSHEEEEVIVYLPHSPQSSLNLYLLSSEPALCGQSAENQSGETVIVPPPEIDSIIPEGTSEEGPCNTERQQEEVRDVLATQCPTILSRNECVVADNLTQNIKPVAMTEKHHDATNEEGQSHAKGAKPSHEKEEVNVRLLHLPQLSDDPYLLSREPALGGNSSENKAAETSIVPPPDLDFPISEGTSKEALGNTYQQQQEEVTGRVEVEQKPSE